MREKYSEYEMVVRLSVLVGNHAARWDRRMGATTTLAMDSEEGKFRDCANSKQIQTWPRHLE